ncbi:SgcJ/EcaC family oxidoreductase [Sphaerisporangium dianthi]|uniref:SgcJ/EcaC family oxidoreductase n=1 Tax=Sphaerisporangium dianthi TaxID=1436120 RepID=A0ABV9CBM3_9ACTN
MGIHRHGRTTIRLALAAGLGIASIGAAPASGATTASGSASAAGTRAPVFAAGRAHAADLAVFTRMRREQARAWERGDSRAYAAAYAPDGDLVNILGEHMHGRQGIAKAIQRHFDRSLKNTRLLELEEHVRFVSPTTAVIVRKGCVLYGGEKACRPDTVSINTSVAVKYAREWLITSFQNTLVHPGGQPPVKPPSTG